MMTLTSPKTQSGSFILEALVSVLIFAVGIIALMGMSAQALNQVGQSKFRNDASNLADELTGDMWIGADLASFAVAAAANPSVSCPVGNAQAAATAWLARVKSVLPAGCATVIVTPITTTGGVVTDAQVAIDISWADNKNAGVRHQYITSMQIAKN